MSKYAERLYAQFQKEKESFHRWLLAALLLGIFYSFVFQPYLTLLTELANLETKQQETDKQIKQTEREIQIATEAIERASRFMGDASEYQRLYDDAKSWVDNIDELEQKYELQSRKVNSLRDSLSQVDQVKWPVDKVPGYHVISLLKKSRPDMMRHYDLKDDCFFRVETDWVACLVSQKRKPINNKLDRVLYDRTMGHEYTALLEKDVEANREKYESGLPKALSGGKLKQWVSEFLKEEQAIIRQWYENMARDRNALTEKSKLHQQVLEIHKLAQVTLDQRKKSFSHTGEIDTPIGPIKLGLHDILASVPFVGLFILSALIKSTRRQLIIRSTFQANGPADETTPEALSLTMPIWLEPFNPRINNILLLVGLAFLAMATLFGLWQVISNPGLAVVEVNLNNIFIVILTMLAAVIFTFLYVRLVANYRQSVNYPQEK